MTQPTLTNWLSILSLGVIWGGTFMVVAVALQGYGPLTVACARTTLGALALLFLMRIMGRHFPVMAPRMVKYLVVMGILNTALPFALLSWGQQYVPSAFAGILSDRVSCSLEQDGSLWVSWPASLLRSAMRCPAS